MANTKPRAPRKSTTTSKDKRANGEGSIYWDKSKKRWIGAAYDINGKLHRKSCLKKSEAEDFCHDQKRVRSLGTRRVITARQLNHYLINRGRSDQVIDLT